MKSYRFNNTPRAFTLIELMVVIAIIGLLIGALLPAFGVVRTRARVTSVVAQFNALDAGITAFRTEQSLGQSLPPSASDNSDDPQLVANPQKKDGEGGSEVRISGAHLLVQALMGADQLGTPGFRDLDRDGMWWNDTHDDDGGAYEIDLITGVPKVTRYGGGGYVDEKSAERAVSLDDLVDKGVILNPDELDKDNIARRELLFTDAWDQPILYYKANGSIIRMLHDNDNDSRGIYRQEDNGIITGTDMDPDGLDFGPGKEDNFYHAIADAKAPDVQKTEVKEVLENADYDNTFARFILKPSVRARPTPVKKDEYLLISAGPDGRYGTADDITNWTREQS